MEHPLRGNVHRAYFVVVFVAGHAQDVRCNVFISASFSQSIRMWFSGSNRTLLIDRLEIQSWSSVLFSRSFVYKFLILVKISWPWEIGRTSVKILVIPAVSCLQRFLNYLATGKCVDIMGINSIYLSASHPENSNNKKRFPCRSTWVRTGHAVEIILFKGLASATVHGITLLEYLFSRIPYWAASFRK